MLFKERCTFWWDRGGPSGNPPASISVCNSCTHLVTQLCNCQDEVPEVTFTVKLHARHPFHQGLALVALLMLSWAHPCGVELALKGNIAQAEGQARRAAMASCQLVPRNATLSA